MKRSELEALGLTKEQIDSVIKTNGADIENAKTVAAAEMKSVQTELDALKEQIKERDKQIDGLKKSSGDNEELKKQIEELQKANKEKDAAHAAEMLKIKLDSAVEKALTESGAKNVKAVRALLNLEGAELDDKGLVKGLDKQIEALKGADDSKFMFADSSVSLAGANPGSSDVGLKGNKPLKDMTYDELTAYLDANPGAKLE